jgi:hypothetical protein
MNALRIQKAKPRRASMRILSTLLSGCAGFLHSKTIEALWRGIEALLVGQVLTVTALGRAAVGNALAKHRIKAADRLAGNWRITANSLRIYRMLAMRWLGLAAGTPTVLVDWTGLPNGFHCLSASVAFQGRSVPLYAEVHPEAKLGNRRVEIRFLANLATILPADCRPIIVTDAGFYTEWCDEVERYEWFFVVRIRNQTKCQLSEDQRWVPVKDLYRLASARPRSLGQIRLTRTKPRWRRLVLVQKPSRRGRSPSKGNTTTAKKHRRKAKEPWVLATNLTTPPRHVVNVYGRRMQIEQNYRDLKDTRWGWSLEHSQSRSAERFAVLVLVAILAMFIVLLAGFVAEQNELHRTYQANTIRSRRVLSLFYLGNQVLLDHSLRPPEIAAAIPAFAARLLAT